MAGKYLRDLDVWADTAIVDDFKGGFVQRFHREACCVSEQYRRSLRQFLTNGVSKVLMRCVDQRRGIVDFPAQNPIVDVVICYWPFDFFAYRDAGELNKKRLISLAIRDCLLAIAQSWNWNPSPIESIHGELESHSYSFTGISKASWLAPDSKHRVRVAFDWQLSAVELMAVLFRNRSKDELARQKLGNLIPAVGCLNDALYPQHGRWISATEFELCTTDFSQHRWRVSFADAMPEQKVRQ